MDWKKDLVKDLLNEDAEHSENDDNCLNEEPQEAAVASSTRRPANVYSAQQNKNKYFSKSKGTYWTNRNSQQSNKKSSNNTQTQNDESAKQVNVTALVQDIFNTVYGIVSGFSALYHNLEELQSKYIKESYEINEKTYPELDEIFKRINKNLDELDTDLKTFNDKLETLKRQVLINVNFNEIKNETIKSLKVINAYLDIITDTKERLTNDVCADKRHKLVVQRLNGGAGTTNIGLRGEYLNKLNNFIDKVKETSLYNDTEIKQGIDALDLRKIAI